MFFLLVVSSLLNFYQFLEFKFIQNAVVTHFELIECSCVRIEFQRESYRSREWNLKNIIDSFNLIRRLGCIHHIHFHHRRDRSWARFFQSELGAEIIRPLGVDEQGNAESSRK